MKDDRKKSNHCMGYQRGMYNDYLPFLHGLIVLHFSETISDSSNESQVFLREMRL